MVIDQYRRERAGSLTMVNTEFRVAINRRIAKYRRASSGIGSNEFHENHSGRA